MMSVQTRMLGDFDTPFVLKLDGNKVDIFTEAKLSMQITFEIGKVVRSKSLRNIKSTSLIRNYAKL